MEAVMPDTEEHSIRLLPSLDTSARYRPGSPPRVGRTLRAALAMRGGVSLAVWIGGAVGELDLLRRIRWTADGSCWFLWRSDEIDGVDDAVFTRATIYAQALAAKGYDCVEFDVLAGASAGGLNSILYAVAQRVGARVDSVLDTWITEGAFWGLLRGPGLTGVDSPLDGDGRFAPGALEALTRLYADPSRVTSHESRHVVVDISSTVIDTEDARDRSTSSGRAQFHFTGADHGSAAAANQNALRKENRRAVPVASVGINLPSQIPDATLRDLARLAYSARATSSLPAGFEPALLYSSFIPATPADDKAHIDMSYAYHIHRGGFGAPYRGVDGGLTDNIPIDRAFRAIRSMASEVYADRAIIYLDPNPPIQPRIRTPRDYPGNSASPTLAAPLPKRTDASSRFLKVIARSLGIRVGKESAEDKADAIQDFRQQLFLATGRSQSVIPLSAAGGLAAAYGSADALTRYAEYRKSSDSNLLMGVLQDPAVWQLGTDLQERHSFAALSLTDLVDLDSHIRAAYGALGGDHPGRLDNAIFGGPSAVMDSCYSLLAWVRELEKANFAATGNTQLGAEAGALPGAAAIGQIANLRRQLYGILDEAIQARDIVLLATCLSILPHDDARDPVSPDLIATAVNTFLGKPTPRMLALREELVTVTSEISALTTVAAAPLAATKWAGVPVIAGTTALQVAAFCAASGIPEALFDVKFWSITSASKVPDVTPFPRLREDDFRRTLRSILALGRPKDVDSDEVARLVGPQPLTAYAKLTGTVLGAFAGFLSTDWRRNDWLWGQLDAASGVLTFLDSLNVSANPAIPADPDAPPPGAAVESAQDEILRGAALTQIAKSTSVAASDARARFAPFTPLPTATSTPDDLRHSLVIGADTLFDLSPGYRIGVASRVIHLAFRSFGRRASGAWTLAATAVLRPLGVLLPTLVDPPRALLIAAILTGLWTIGSVQGDSDVNLVTTFGPSNKRIDLATAEWVWILLPLIALAVVVGAGLSIRSTRKRWARIADLLSSLTAPTSYEWSRFAAYRASSARAAIVLWVGGIVLFALTLVTNFFGQITWASTVSAFIVGIGLTVLAGLRAGAVAAPSGFRVRNYLVGGIATVVFLIAVARPAVFAAAADDLAHSLRIVQLLGRSDFEQVQHLPVVAAAAAFAISLICNWGWIAGSRPTPRAGTGTGTAGIVVGACGIWILEACAAAIVAFFATLLMVRLTGQPDSHLVRAICVVVGLCISATAQWCLSQIPTRYQPLDEARRASGH
jgi:hypothetical protein